MGKFGNLSGAADGTFRVRLLDRKTEQPIKDKAGEEAYVEVIYSNSAVGRTLDADLARERAALGKRDTQLELNIMKLARMTKGWHLVDPVTRDVIDVSPTIENAEEFYSLPLASDYFVQAWVASHAAENFYAGLVKELIRFAEFEFRNARKESDGASEGTHKSSAAVQWERLGKPQVAKVLTPDPPHFPDELSYLWSWYRQHELGLAINGMVPPVVTWEGLEAWSKIVDVRLQPWEARTMAVLGYTRFAVNSEKIEAAAKK